MIASPIPIISVQGSALRVQMLKYLNHTLNALPCTLISVSSQSPISRSLHIIDTRCTIGCNGSTNETHERAYPKSPFAPRNRRARVFKMPFMRRGRFGASRLYRLRHVPRAAGFERREKESQGGKARESESRSKIEDTNIRISTNATNKYEYL